MKNLAYTLVAGALIIAQEQIKLNIDKGRHYDRIISDAAK